jgi:hypothetical protein
MHLAPWFAKYKDSQNSRRTTVFMQMIDPMRMIYPLLGGVVMPRGVVIPGILRERNSRLFLFKAAFSI